MAPRYLAAGVADDVEQPPPTARQSRYRQNSQRCEAKTHQGKGPRCRRLATAGGRWCEAHQPNRKYHDRLHREQEMAQTTQDMEVFAARVAKAKRIREEAQVELMEGSKVGVRVLTELAADESAPAHVRTKASELILRFSGSSLEKSQVEVSGKVSVEHTGEVAHTVLDRLGSLTEAAPAHLRGQLTNIVEAEVISDSDDD